MACGPSLLTATAEADEVTTVGAWGMLGVPGTFRGAESDGEEVAWEQAAPNHATTGIVLRRVCRRVQMAARIEV